MTVTPEAVAEAVGCLKVGGLVAFPTETVYGLGADATIALRVPAHAVARDLLAAFGGPIVAPSANRSGHVSPTTAQHVLSDLRGRIDLLLDGGPSPIGLESTIVACIGEPKLLRSGGLPRTDIERMLGHPLAVGSPFAETGAEAPIAPGQLASHYAPRTPLRLNANSVGA